MEKIEISPYVEQCSLQFQNCGWVLNVSFRLIKSGLLSV